MPSATVLHKIGERVREASIQAAWAQWASLGANALRGQDGGGPRSIIDPEALLLLSLCLEPAERRLRDFTYWWAGVGSELLSVQRTKTLLKSFPPGAGERLGAFAGQAVEAGDRRWRRYVPSESPVAGGRKGKGADSPRLGAPSALVLRLRAGFGVSAKADVLAYLLGIGERPAGTQETAEATKYSRATVGNALGDMTQAGFIQETSERPARYFAPVRLWTELLRLDGQHSAPEGAPSWRYWAGAFAFLAHVDRLAQGADEKSTYLLSSRARDLYKRYESAFERNRIQVPRPERYRGPAYLEGLQETVEVLSGWVVEHV